MEKRQILEYLKEAVKSKIQEAEVELDSIFQSKTHETKSSAGDKYETGMAMLQLEEQKAAVQLAKAKSTEQVLSRIDGDIVHKEVQLGSLIETSQGYYFLAIPFGKLAIEENEIFVLSITSPIGQLLFGKKIGEEFIFQSNKIHITGLK